MGAVEWTAERVALEVGSAVATEQDVKAAPAVTEAAQLQLHRPCQAAFSSYH